MSVSSPELIEPVAVLPDRMVHNVFEDRDGTPDLLSQQGFEEYLHERAEALKEGLPPQTYVVEEVETVRRLSFPWSERPFIQRWAKASLVGLLAINAALNMAINDKQAVKDVTEIAQGTADSVGDHFDHDEVLVTGRQEVRILRRPAYLSERQRNYTFQSEVGDTEVNPNAADKVVDFLQDRVDNGGKVLSIQIIGEASGEWGQDDTSLLREDDGNETLAKARADGLKLKIEQEAVARGISIPEPETVGTEPLYDRTQYNIIQYAIDSHGYDSFTEVKEIYQDDPDRLPTVLRRLMDIHLDEMRGASVEAIVQMPDQVERVIVPLPDQVMEVQDDPANTDQDYGLVLIPALLPPARLEDRQKIKTHEEYDPGLAPDNVWVELYPQALKEDGELVEDAWAYTRKYQLLQREDRIKTVLRHDYQDAEGQEQSLHLMFVDHVPTKATLDSLKPMLEEAGRMRDGKVGQKLKAIAIYPSSNAGKNVPADVIGLGIDEQERFGVHGIAMPLLGLVEMHMPADPTQEELEDFEAAKWTFAHEVAGHFTDVKDGPLRLKRVGNSPRQDYTSPNPWEGAAGDEYNRLMNEPKKQSWWSRFRHGKTGRWLIRRSLNDRDGVAHDFEDRVDDGNPQIAQSILTRLPDEFPTRYSRRNEHELHAEVAAAVTTGIDIPFEEARPVFTAVPSPEVPNGFAQGYTVDKRLQRMFAERVGSDPEADHLGWNEEQLARWRKVGFVGAAAGDLVMRNLSNDARQLPLPDRSDMIRVMVGVGRTEKAAA